MAGDDHHKPVTAPQCAMLHRGLLWHGVALGARAGTRVIAQCKIMGSLAWAPHC